MSRVVERENHFNEMFSTIFFITEFSSKKIPVEMVRCSISIKTDESENQSFDFDSLNEMEKFSSSVEENICFVKRAE